MVEQVSLSSCEYDKLIDEYIKSGFKKEKSSMITPPFVSESPFAMECKLYDIIELGGKPGSGNLVLGEIVCFHVREDILDKDNKISPYDLDPIARLGYNYYSRAKDGLFEVFKPRYNGIGFDALPLIVKESKYLNGNELAKLAGVKEIPIKSNKNLKLDSLNNDEIFLIIKQLLKDNHIDDAWQAVLKISKENV